MPASSVTTRVSLKYLNNPSSTGLEGPVTPIAVTLLPLTSVHGRTMVSSCPENTLKSVIANTQVFLTLIFAIYLYKEKSQVERQDQKVKIPLSSLWTINFFSPFIVF